MKRNTSVWLTGSRGFIGKHLIQGLKKNSIDYKCFSKKRSMENTENDLFYMDYSSKDNINTYIQEFGCPYSFIHLGWGDMTSPMSGLHLTDNVRDAKILIDTFYLAGLKKFIFIGSMNEYGARVGSLSENMKPAGRLINYAKGKIQVAQHGFSMADYFGKQFIHIRLFYVYGPGQRQGSLINELFEAYQKNRGPKIGPCDHYRDYIYVKDVVEGIVRSILSRYSGINLVEI